MAILDKNLESEVRPSPNLVVILLLAFALIFSLMQDDWTTASNASQVRLFTILLYVTPGIIWLLNQWQPHICRWAAVGGFVAVLYFGMAWLNLLDFLALVAVPIVIAAILLGPPAVTVTAISETLLLLILPLYTPIQLQLLTLIVVLVAIWGTSGLLFFTFRPRYTLTDWLWEHFQQSQFLLEEARKRKVELAQALDDLAQANRHMALLNERLEALHLIAEEAQKAKADFVAKVSHEFRTPLNMVIGLIDVLIETPDIYDRELPPPLLEDLAIVQRNCEHLASMINDVLDLSQAEVGRLVLRREWVDLLDEVNNALIVVRPLLDKKGLALKLDLPDDLPKVYCDRTRIRQVILNLASNAARYTDQGQISVEMKAQGPNVIVSIIDTGPGIAVEDAQQIFDPFYQASGDAGRWQEGSGLGLSISKQFIESHHGQIWLESAVGQGSNFSFKLPISPAPVTNGPIGWINENWLWYERTTWPNLPEIPHKQRLIVYDEVGSLVPLLKPYLNDVDFVYVDSLAQAKQKLEGYPAHGIIVNAASAGRLSALTGQAKLQISDIPIIGCTFPLQIDHALAAGAAGYLIKPVTRADLKKAVELIKGPIRRILIIDDNQDVRKLLTRMLHTFDKSIEVTGTSSGEQGLDMLHGQPPDLVLLDIILPDVDGWEVLKHKNQDDMIRDIPVIIISAQDPAVQVVTTDSMVTSVAQGIPVSKLLRSALDFSNLLLNPNPLDEVGG